MNKNNFSSPLSLRNVQITDTFWKKEMELVRTEVIPYQWAALNDQVEGAAPSFCMHNFKVEKLGYAIANWNRGQAQTKMASMLAQYAGKMELILANNDDMALGAIDALKASGIPKEEWPMVVGIDGTDPGLEAVEKGEMIGTVYNDKEGQAKGMLDLAFALATGEGLEDIELESNRYIRLPYQKVTKENVSNFRK